VVFIPNFTDTHAITSTKPMLVQVLKKCDDWERRNAYIGQKKRMQNEILHNWLLLSLACWLMYATMFVYNANLKVDTTREILTVHGYDDILQKCLLM